MKKIVVTGTRGIPGVMGGVETHCEELFPRLAERGWDVTVVRRSNYVEDGLKEWKGVKLGLKSTPRQLGKCRARLRKGAILCETSPRVNHRIISMGGTTSEKESNGCIAAP